MRKVHYARGAEGARWKKKKQDRARKDGPLHYPQNRSEEIEPFWRICKSSLSLARNNAVATGLWPVMQIEGLLCVERPTWPWLQRG